eukprot:1800135-Karenia_brevis.AAC.1
MLTVCHAWDTKQRMEKSSHVNFTCRFLSCKRPLCRTADACGATRVWHRKHVKIQSKDQFFFSSCSNSIHTKRGSLTVHLNDWLPSGVTS